MKTIPRRLKGAGILLLAVALPSYGDDQAARAGKRLSRSLMAAVTAEVVVDRWPCGEAIIPIGWNDVTRDEALAVGLTDLCMIDWRRDVVVPEPVYPWHVGLPRWRPRCPPKAALTFDRYAVARGELDRSTARPSMICPQLDIGRANVITYRTLREWQGYLVDTALGAYVCEEATDRDFGTIYPLAALSPSIRGPLLRAEAKHTENALVVTLYEDERAVQAVKTPLERELRNPIVLAYRRIGDQLAAVVGERDKPRWRADAAASGAYLVSGPPGDMIPLPDGRDIVDKSLGSHDREVESAIGTCAIGGAEEYVAAYWAHHRVATGRGEASVVTDIDMLWCAGQGECHLAYATFTIARGEKLISWNSRDRKPTRRDRQSLALSSLLNGGYPFTVGAGGAADVIWAYEPESILQVRIGAAKAAD